MSLATCDVLAVADMDLPPSVGEALLDMGRACNTAVLAVNQGALLEEVARNAAGVESTRWTEPTSMGRAAQDLAGCALTYVEMLVVVYTQTATRLGLYASRVAQGIFAGQDPLPPSKGLDIAPSQLITCPEAFLPRPQIPAGLLAKDVVVDQTNELLELHTQLREVIQRVALADPTAYDGIEVAARRGPGAVDLVVDFPVALHRYGAALTWLVGLVRADPSDPLTV